MKRISELSPNNRHSWQPVQAHIFSVHRAPRDNVRTERTEITYSYTVNGELHLGDFVDYGKIPQHDLRRGAVITVLYNPRNPSQSRLQRHNSFGLWQIIWPIIGVSIVILKFAGHGLLTFLLERSHF